MLAGHLNQNTVGMHPIFMPNITPPTRLPEASTMPPTSGSGSRISCLTCVGLLKASLKMTRQSRSAAASSPPGLNQTFRGFLANTQLKGEKRPLNPGMPCDALLILPSVFSKLLNDTPCLARKACLVSLISSTLLSSGSSIVLAFPSKI